MRDSYPQRLSRRIVPFPVSDLCIAFLPRSGVLSRHDTDVQVTPRDYRRRRASPRGWRDRCRSQGLAPVGAARGNPMRVVTPANSIARLPGSLVNTLEVSVPVIAQCELRHALRLHDFCSVALAWCVANAYIGNNSTLSIRPRQVPRRRHPHWAPIAQHPRWSRRRPRRRHRCRHRPVPTPDPERPSRPAPQTGTLPRVLMRIR